MTTKQPSKRVLNCPGRFGKLTFKMKTFSLRLELRFILIITMINKQFDIFSNYPVVGVATGF